MTATQLFIPATSWSMVAERPATTGSAGSEFANHLIIKQTVWDSPLRVAQLDDWWCLLWLNSCGVCGSTVDLLLQMTGVFSDDHLIQLEIYCIWYVTPGEWNRNVFCPAVFIAIPYHLLWINDGEPVRTCVSHHWTCSTIFASDCRIRVFAIA